MKIAAALFYGVAAALLATGVRELLTGFEENGCSMTYMFESPEYRRVSLPRRVSRLYPAYGLYLYGEGTYALESRALKLTGAPVLFLPGNAGSYKQARSLGSVALRKAENMEDGVHLNVFTVDFNEELVALYGGSLRRQTLFLHECIKAVLRLYKGQDRAPSTVVLVGHSMGGVVARALFTLPRFSPHLPWTRTCWRWVKHADRLANVTVLSVGGGYRDYQVRSGLTSLPCSPGDPNKLSLVATAVPRTWVSTDHLSIVWCKELVLATVRALFDLIEPETNQLTDSVIRRREVLEHHFIRHPVRMLDEIQEPSLPLPDFPEAWSEVNALRLAYSTPKEGQDKYFLFALSSRRKAYSHFYCRSNNMEMSSWVHGCVQKTGSMCVRAVDLSLGTELLPPYKVLTLSLSDLSSVSHLVVGASNLNGKQFTVECEWQRQESQTASLPVPHVLSFGLTSSEVTVNSSGLLHSVELEHFHQVYQSFRITVSSRCKVQKDRLANVYRVKVPWFREDSLTTASVPSVTEISGMLHTSRPGNTSNVLLQLHTAPNCQYKVLVRTSFPSVLGQVLRFCSPLVPVYTAVTLLLACGGQLWSIAKTGKALEAIQAVGWGLQPHKVGLPVYLLHLLLGCRPFQDAWWALGLPAMDALPPTAPDRLSPDMEAVPADQWPRLLSPLLYLLGAAVAFWGSALLCLSLRLLSLAMAPLHRPSVSPDCGTLGRQTQLLLILALSIVGGTSCGALSIFTAFLLHLYRVLRLQMAERSLSHMLNLAPDKLKASEKNGVSPGGGSTEYNGGGPLLDEGLLDEVRNDLQLHYSLSVLFTLPIMLSAPSLIHWTRNLRYSARLEPDSLWPHTLPLMAAIILLTNCSCRALSNSKLLRLVCCLPLPLCVAMVTFSPLHLYRVLYFLSAVLVPLALSGLL
ncbi:hypothetical protein NHX12_006839 [Muraenolepis orangiensis]|uniref:GPI inositol-deacylase n=1 Tax=Muraenolepis orangiensis TaxID=630683 RepID=A0A9Q0DSA1_9TELE|nr:hypothetical protein NHX12_006839 [Muraenolepis orangiensis]